MIQVKNRKTGKIAYIVNEGEKITLQFEDETTKEYTKGSFKKMYVKTGEVKVEEKVANKKVEEEEEVMEQIAMTTDEEPQVEEVKTEEVATEKVEEKVEEKTLVEKIIDVVKAFAENPNYNSNETQLEYVERKTISKITLNGRNLFEMDIQKKGVVFYFNTSQLQEKYVNLMTKILSPEIYDWANNGVYKVISESQFDNLNELMADACRGRLVANEIKEQEKFAKQQAKEEAKKKKQEEKANKESK